MSGFGLESGSSLILGLQLGLSQGSGLSLLLVLGPSLELGLRLSLWLGSGSDWGCSQLTHLDFLLQVPRTPRPGVESADSRRLATKHSKKALKASLTLGILLGMFFVTWLPFFMANIAQVMPLQGAGESRCCWGGPEPHPSPDRGREEGGLPLVVYACVCVSQTCWVGWSVSLPRDQA